MDDDSEHNGLVGWILGFAVTLAVTVALMSTIVAVTGGGAPVPAPAAAVPAAAVPAAAAPVPAPTAPAAAIARIYFDSGKADLPADGTAALQPLVEAVRGRADARLAVSGFHDATGSPELNAELAKQRAIAVQAALVAAGVDAARVALRKPQQTQGGPDDRDARRVEVTLE